MWNSFPHDLQVGSDLNSQLDALQAEKETLRKSVNEKECELISTKGLIQEKELLLSQEAEKRAKEVQELQEKLVEKVRRRNIEIGGSFPLPHHWGRQEGDGVSPGLGWKGRRKPARPPGFPWTHIQGRGLVTCKHTWLIYVLRQKSHEQNLQQKLLDDQFRILQGTIKEAENIIQDAVSKLDDPLHIRCTSSPGES